MNEELLESIILDDGIEYYIFDTEIIDGILYTMFVNVNDEEDICFRKTIVEDGNNFFVGLDNEKEFEKIVLIFSKKNLN